MSSWVTCVQKNHGSLNMKRNQMVTLQTIATLKERLHDKANVMSPQISHTSQWLESCENGPSLWDKVK